jgi:hypothetical protein
MGSSAKYNVRFGDSAFTIVYEDARASSHYTFDGSVSRGINGKYILYLGEPPEPDAEHSAEWINVMTEPVIHFLESCGYHVVAYPAWSKNPPGGGST